MTHYLFFRVEITHDYEETPATKEFRLLSDNECFILAQQIDLLLNTLHINPSIMISVLNFDFNCLVVSLIGISIKDFKDLLNEITLPTESEIYHMPLLEKEFTKEEIGDHHLQVKEKRTTRVTFMEFIPMFGKENGQHVNLNFSDMIC